MYVHTTLMTLYKELTYDGEECVARIRGIQFCILGPDEIRRRSVAEITKTDTYNINEPVMNGLFDPRMGVIDNNKICKTCEQRNTFCPGHFGHIELARPLFHVQFFPIVQKLLRCVCFRCSKILVDLNDPAVKAAMKKGDRQKRCEHMHKLCSSVKRCGKETLDGCGARQPDRIAKTDAMRILMEWKDLGETDDAEGEAAVRRQVFGADDVLRILRRITDEDADALGFCPKFNRPEWMICTVLPVPPPCVRPSVRNDTGVRKEDDLTHKLGDIIKYNNLVKQRIEKGASYDNVEWHVCCLQQHVATLIDNTGAFVSKDRTGRVFRTICDRLGRKEGRIRGNLMGKRVDFSARTVITPDPNISIDELGVPIKIAMNLTFPEVVNAFNMDRMYRLVRNGPDQYPGAKHIRKGHRTIRLRGNDLSAIVLEPGDIVERHLANGDYVLFNRQPSLHKMSMMAHRVRVMPHNTFRLNVCVCKSYNADFDGDN
jgi:DNA-directed RNA polymerase II subunit RPB1